MLFGTLDTNAQKIERLLKKKKYSEAIEFCSNCKIPAEQNVSYIKVANSYFQDKNYISAIDFYIKGKDINGYELANEKQGDIEFQNKNFIIAAKYYIEARNKEKLISSYLEQANSEFNEKSYLKAAEYYTIAEQKNKTSLSYKKFADGEFANKNYEQSILYYKKANDSTNILKAYNEQAYIEFENKNYIKSTEYFELANDTLNLKKSKKYLGLKYLNEKKYSEAIACFIEIKDTENLKKAYQQFANKTYSDNNYKQAIEYFVLAGDNNGIYNSYMSLADYAYTNKQFKLALSYLEDCKKIFPNNNELLNKIGQYSNFITDNRDGQIYPIVKIGNQWWMAENLNYTSKNLYEEYQDANYPRTYYKITDYQAKYGLLYSLKVAEKVCPSGWHLPTNAEWEELEINIGVTESKIKQDEYLRGYEVVGKLLSKSSLWETGYGSEKISNSTGFNVSPGGYGWYKIQRDAGQLLVPSFAKVGEEAHFWSSTKVGSYAIEGVTRIFRTKEIRIERDAVNCWNSVRCIKD